MPTTLKMTQEITARNSGKANLDVAGKLTNGMIPEMFITKMKPNSVTR